MVLYSIVRESFIYIRRWLKWIRMGCLIKFLNVRIESRMKVPVKELTLNNSIAYFSILDFDELTQFKPLFDGFCIIRLSKVIHLIEIKGNKASLDDLIIELV
jgi:hypothetical protein